MFTFEQVTNIYKSKYIVAYFVYSIILRKATTMGLRYGHSTRYHKRLLIHLFSVAIVIYGNYCDLYIQYLTLCLSSILNLFLQAVNGNTNPPMMADLAIVLSLHENAYPTLVHLKMAELVMEHAIGILDLQQFRLYFSTALNFVDFYYFLSYEQPLITKPKKYLEILLTLMVFSAYTFYLLSTWLSDQAHLELINIQYHDDFYIALLKTSLLLLKDEEKRLGLRLEGEPIINVRFHENVLTTTRINKHIPPLDNLEVTEYKERHFVGVEYLKALYFSLKSIFYTFLLLLEKPSKSSNLTDSDYQPSTIDDSDMTSILGDNNFKVKNAELLNLVKDQYQPITAIKQPVGYDLRTNIQPPAMETQDTCAICYSNARCIILRPCNCFILCNECRILLAQAGTVECPFCRRHIDAYSRLYRP